MEIIAVVDQPLVPENAPSLARKVFCIDESGWHQTPGFLPKFQAAVAGGADFRGSDGSGRGIPLRSPAAFVERDLKRLANTALASPQDVKLRFLVDGDSDARDLMTYYQALAFYTVEHGGDFTFYSKGAGGALAELAMPAHRRILLKGSQLTFRSPVSRRGLVGYTPEVGTLDYANVVYWQILREFLLRNAVEGMRDKIRYLLDEVEMDPKNPQRQISLSADEAWDIGLANEPMASVDDLCRNFERSCGEIVESLSDNHPVRMFFDVEEREARYRQSRRPPVLKEIPGDGNGDRRAVRRSHLRVVK